VPRDGGIDDESRGLRLLEEDARDHGRIAIGAGDDRPEPVDRRRGQAARSILITASSSVGWRPA
jgi:hypothetical protein